MFEFLRSLLREDAPPKEDGAAEARPRGRCPRCDVGLKADHGALHEAVCHGCQGRFLPVAAVERLVVGELGIRGEVLRELVGHFAGPRLLCPECARRTHPITLRGVHLDLCVGCGGLWCDAGELSRLSDGRYEEIQAPWELEAPDPDLPVVEAELIDPGLLAPASTMRGSFGVFHLDAAAPPEAALVDAFQRTSPFVRGDATAVLRDFCGVLAEGLSEGQARALAGTLQERGVAAVLVEDTWLRLPRPRRVTRLEASDDGVKVPDQYGHLATIPWPEVRMVSAGNIEGQGGLRQRLEERRTRAGGGLMRYEKVELEVGYAHEERSALTLELVVGQPFKRYRLELDDASHGWFPGGAEAAFAPLVAGVLQRARYAVLNEGAARVAQGLSPPVLRYRTPRRFEREQGWLLWRYLGPGAQLASAR